MEDQLVTVGLKNLNLLSGDLLVDEQTDGSETCGTLEVLVGDISLTNFALVASSLEEDIIVIIPLSSKVNSPNPIKNE